MPSVNEEIDDLEVRHAVYLQRFSTSVVRRMIGLLAEADADLVAEIARRDPTAVTGAWSRKRLDALLESIRVTNRDAHRLLGRELTKELRDFAGYEAGFQARLIDKAVPIALDIVVPAAEQIAAATLARPFQGRLLREWVTGLERASYDRLRSAVRIGFLEGEGIDRIIRRVAGTAALRHADGATAVSKRSTEALVRTAINHTANHAREEVYAANSDLVKAVKWSSTLDGRTSAICRARDGKVYPLNEGPRPPAHPNCRSSTVPITKSWRELGFDLDELPPGTRASMNGQVPADQSYGQWLRKQPGEFQDEVLGPTKAKLFREGGLDVDRFVDTRTGHEYTLDELRRRESKAFDKAGINA